MTFAQAVRESLAAGEIAGAVAAVAAPELLRVEAWGLHDLDTQASMERDTIFRMASASKCVFAAAGLILLEDGKFALDDPLAKWAPELADRRVLARPDAEVEDTVPAARQITMFDVLSFQLGIGMYLAAQATPLLMAMMAAGLAPQTEPVELTPDEFLARLGELPLAHQPGETFMYHTGEDVLRSVIPRIAGQSLGEYLAERVFEPLGMADSGLSVPQGKRDRFSHCYYAAKPGEALAIWDAPDGRFAEDPLFPNQICSTMSDYLNFFEMVLGKGEFHGRRFLSPESIALMTTDHLTSEQKQRSPAPDQFWQNRGWGMGGTVYARSLPQGPNQGAYSWFGGYGPHFIVDPKRGSAVVLMIPRLVQSYNDTTLGYQFELDTYRDVLSGEQRSGR